MPKKFQFTTNNDDEDNFTGVMESVGDICMYYQIASFPNPKTNRYHVRKFVIGENNVFNSIKDYYLQNKTCNRLLETKNPNQYKIYSVYDLKGIQYPNMNDIIIARSSLTTNKTNFTGFANV